MQGKSERMNLSLSQRTKDRIEQLKDDRDRTATAVVTRLVDEAHAKRETQEATT